MIGTSGEFSSTIALSMPSAVSVERTDDTARQLDDSTRKQLEALGYID